jgi:tetratricopeptide (TPR) repeat protein
VANTLTFLGYQPIWQDTVATEGGDLWGLLTQQIDQCKGVVHLVGQCYGTEPPAADEKFGRVSYTQYEALYARQQGKKVWCFLIDERYPTDVCKDESEELRELQKTYRRSIQSNALVFHPIASPEALEASVLKLRDDLTRLRRGVKQWALGFAAVLILVVALLIWLLFSIAQERKLLMRVLERYPQEETQQVVFSQPLEEPAIVQKRVYEKLGKEFHLDSDLLRQKLPSLAEKLRRSPDAPSYVRASAAFVSKDYVEAERLALQAFEESRKTASAPSRTVQALELAGLAAQNATQYSRAMQHFRDAEQFTNPNRDAEEWATLQDAIANLLMAQGKYSDAEKLFRRVIEVRTRVLGPEDPNTLASRHWLIYTLNGQDKHAEALSEARQVLVLREKILGSEHPDTLLSRYNLANALYYNGKYAEAEAEYHEVIELDEKVLGPEDSRTFAARVGLANVFNNEGKLAESETLYRSVIKLDQEVYGPEHPITLNDRMNLATGLQAAGKYLAAEAEYRFVIRAQEKHIGSEHPDTLSTRNNFAELLDDEGKYSEAEVECRRIISLEEKVVGPEALLTLNSRGNLAVALIGQRKFAEAETQYRDVMILMERKLGLDYPDTVDFTVKFAVGLAHQGRIQDTREIVRRAEERARKILGPDHPLIRRYAKLAVDLETSH